MKTLRIVLALAAFFALGFAPQSTSAQGCNQTFKPMEAGSRGATATTMQPALSG